MLAVKTQNVLQQVAVKLSNYQHLTGSESEGFGCLPSKTAFQILLGSDFLDEDVRYQVFVCVVIRVLVGVYIIRKWEYNGKGQGMN